MIKTCATIANSAIDSVTSRSSCALWKLTSRRRRALTRRRGRRQGAEQTLLCGSEHTVAVKADTVGFPVQMMMIVCEGFSHSVS